MKNLMNIFVAVLVSIVALPPVAQVFAVSKGDLSKDLRISIPYTSIVVDQKVTASAESSSMNLAAALIIWKLDDTEIGRGIGLTEIAFSLDSFTTHKLIVDVTAQDGANRIEEVPIKASDVDILYEALTYTPPLYGGRALPTLGSDVRLHAVSSSAPAGSSIYTWRRDGTILKKASGLGKDSLTTNLGMFDDTALFSVSVSSLSGEFIGENSIRIHTVDPELRIYEERALIGTWFNTTLEHNRLPSSEYDVRVFPFFMSTSAPQLNIISYNWKLSGAAIDGGDDYSRARIIPQSENYSISVNADHTQKLLQSSQLKTQITGGVTGIGATLFGL
jgi:hypothetical protein